MKSIPTGSIVRQPAGLNKPAQRRLLGHCGRRVLIQLGLLCGLQQSLIRNSRRRAAFQYGELVLSTRTGLSGLIIECPFS